MKQHEKKHHQTKRNETKQNVTKRNEKFRNYTGKTLFEQRQQHVRASYRSEQAQQQQGVSGHKNLPGLKNCVASPYLAVSRPKMLLVAENKYLRVFRSDWIFEHRIVTSVQISNQIEKPATPIIRYPLGNKVLPRGVTNSK